MLKRILVGAALSALVGLVQVRSAAADCGPSAVCGDVAASIYGEVILGGIRITWSTNDEPGSGMYYAIYRYNCGTPNTCMVFVTNVTAVGSCNSTQPYTYDDDPPSPDTDWTYVVEVRRTDGSRVCGVDIDPQ